MLSQTPSAGIVRQPKILFHIEPVILLTDIICHDIEEVDILLQIHNIEAT